MQRHPPLVHYLDAGYLGTAQPAGASNLNSFGPSLHGAGQGLLHSPAVGNSAPNLLSHRSGHQKGIKLRLGHLLDIQDDPLADELLKVAPHLINPLAAAPDDDAGPGSMDGYRYLVGLALNLNQGDTGIFIFFVNGPPQLEVLLQIVNKMPIGMPLCLPIAYRAKSKSDRMNLASH